MADNMAGYVFTKNLIRFVIKEITYENNLEKYPYFLWYCAVDCNDMVLP